MKTFRLLIILKFISITAFGQTKAARKSFDQLSTQKIIKFDDATFTFDSSTSTVYNSTFSKVKSKLNNFKLEDFECEEKSIILADVLIDKNTKKRALLTFDVCPEEEFNLYDIATKKKISSFPALGIIIPGNGTVYTFGHTNEFNLRQKFKLEGSSFVEEIQPFYYIGLPSKTLREVKIHSDKELTKVIATLPANYEIEVLLAEKPFANKIYLVRTNFGLIGWAALKVDQYKSVDIEGLFYNND